MEIYPEKRVARRAILASWLGWLMDGYITIAYVLQISVLSLLFFPGALYLLYFAFFFINGLARAIGSAVLGNFIGDRIGRRRMMIVTVSIFSVSSAAMGLIPTYSHIGVFSTIIMGFLLLIMGLFAGAEYGGGAALSMENIPPERRNLIGAFVQSGFGTGYAILAVVFLVLTGGLTGAQYMEYGWRILFLTTGVVGLITFAVRNLTRETSVFEETIKKGEVERAPLVKFLLEQWKGIISMVIITGSLLFINTGTFSLYPTLLTGPLGVAQSSIGFPLLVVNAVSVVGVILGGLIASKSRRKMPYMLAYSITFIITTIAIATFVFREGLLVVTVLFTIQGFFEAMIFSTLPAFLSELFSKRFRTTGVGFVYNIGSTIGASAFFLIPYLSGMYSYNTVWPVSLIIFSFVMIFGIMISWVRFEKGMETKDMIVK